VANQKCTKRSTNLEGMIFPFQGKGGEGSEENRDDKAELKIIFLFINYPYIPFRFLSF
jgi:hypothetical protein